MRGMGVQARDMERCLEWYPRISTLTGNMDLDMLIPRGSRFLNINGLSLGARVNHEDD